MNGINAAEKEKETEELEALPEREKKEWEKEYERKIEKRRNRQKILIPLFLISIFVESLIVLFINDKNTKIALFFLTSPFLVISLLEVISFLARIIERGATHELLCESIKRKKSDLFEAWVILVFYYGLLGFFLAFLIDNSILKEQYLENTGGSAVS